MAGRYEGIHGSARWVFSIAVSEVTALYGAVQTNPGGMMRGVSETGVLRRYGEGGFKEI